MSFLPDVIARKGARHILTLQANAPNILFGVGVVGTVASTVLACRATLKVEAVLATAENDNEIVAKMQDEQYSEEDRGRDLLLIKARTAGQLLRLYGPSILVGAASIGCLTKSHNILAERNAALAAAYVALDRGFREYRARVINRYSEDVDRELRYGTEEVKVVDDPTGRAKTVTRVASGTPSIYARFFDQLSQNWDKDPEYNLLFLRCQQNYANDLLLKRGHVFLNDVYDMLGIPRSREGAVVGWCLKSMVSDRYIDFGIWGGDQKAIDFVNGREGAILLDFNVDGLIYELIDDHDRGELGWQR